MKKYRFRRWQRAFCTIGTIGAVRIWGRATDLHGKPIYYVRDYRPQPRRNIQWVDESDLQPLEKRS